MKGWPDKPDRGGSWIYLSRELFADLLGVFDAEIAALRLELASSGRLLGRAVLLLGAAAVLLVWLPALLGLLLFQVLVLWVPAWLAGLILLVLLLVVAAGLIVLGWRRMKVAENPADTVIRRLRVHLNWWRTDVALHPKPPDMPAEESVVDKVVEEELV